MKLPARIIPGLIVAALCWNASAQELPVPALDESPKPWLVYSVSNADSASSSVMAAWQTEDGLKTERVLAAPYLLVEPLSGSKFLISSGNSEADSARYVIDLASGERLSISERRGFDPLGARLPGKRFAVNTPSSTVSLIQDADGASELEFLTVNYNTMTVDRKSLDKALFKEPFDDGVRLYVAPDGKHIGFLEASTAPENTENLLRFRLKVYHFSNGSVNVVDDEVYIQHSRNARTPFVWPAIGWFDNTHIIYTHCEPQVIDGPDQTLVKFRKVEVEKASKESVLDQLLPLVHESPSFRRDTETNHIIYSHPTQTSEDFIVLAEATTLVPAPSNNHGLVLKKGAGIVQVLNKGEIILNEEHFGENVDGIVSRSLQHTAFTLSTPGDGADLPQQSDLFVSIKRESAMKVGDTAYAIEPLVWIE